MSDLDRQIRYLKGVGPKIESLFRKVGVLSVKDLLYYFPAAYQDRGRVVRISALRPGEPAVISGKIIVVNLRGRKGVFSRKNNILSVIVADSSGTVECTWFNQLYLKNSLKKGRDFFFYGKPSLYRNRLQMVSPEHEPFRPGVECGFCRITGVYRLTEGISQKRVRKAVSQAIESLDAAVKDSLPSYIRQNLKLPGLKASFENIHLPKTLEAANAARRRFIFEELFFSQILVYLRKAKRVLTPGIRFGIDQEFIGQIRGKLDFSLTADQEKVLTEIFSDMGKNHPMHRLLQGDVGSGKTVVAAFAVGVCVRNGFQCSFMVPTEVLVYQHYETLKELFSGFGFKIEALTSGVNRQKRDDIISGLDKGTLDIIVGTHSLLEENVRFRNLGLVIIDEQHKFGVSQRALLPRKGLNPDCLIMSATPIPRSLALSLYGDLDSSLIKTLPASRKQPLTVVVEENKREWVYELIRQKVKEGRQCYIVYPLIEESENIDLRSLEEMFSHLKEVFPGFAVDVFHGRMKKEAKQKVIRDFKENKVRILVSTTVIEVGVNVENATVMVVENPERFGLAQLHQLRGRIRRAGYRPYFILIAPDSISDLARKRLDIIEQSSDGFIIAEEDLKIRGPGDFFGSTQWGYPQLKIANPLQDLDLLSMARRAAYNLVKSDPGLKKPCNSEIREHLSFWLEK